MDSDYEEKLVNIENNVQDETSLAWEKLCEYVEKVAEEGSEEFSPYEYLGEELYFQIYTLPKTIAKLKKVKHILLYASKIKRIPPEIGEMEALENFDPYTSYDLHWFPYEITNCKNLKDSRVSTRALYGNHKYRKPFPDLTNNPVYYNQEIKCSICKKEITQEQTNQLWITLKIGTDISPLLVNSCSKECERKLPQPPKAYIQFPHKGGKKLEQPTHKEWQKEYVTTWRETKKTRNKSIFAMLKLIRKIWEK